MRAAAVLSLLLAAASAEAGDAGDLLPREGSGWEGFAPGSSVRLKRTVVPEGRAPMVTITTITLRRVDKGTLTLESTGTNALGMQSTTKNTLPRHGEAGEGERARAEDLPGETLAVAGRRVACARRRVTVTSAAGKRVVTTWIGASPRMLVKRSVQHLDAAGREVRTDTMLLVATGERREVGGRTVACLKYRTLARQGKRTETGEAWTSREVPGNVVRQDVEIKEGARRLMTMRVEAIGLSFPR